MLDGAQSEEEGLYFVVFLEQLRCFGCSFFCLGFVLDNPGVIDGKLDFAWGSHGFVSPG